ncbi:hypothetical protein [Occultella aeris]|uniref:hypothetical protein n=1 Tax=Occultella aeris TaxID=2761496 RepID=UPI0018D2BB6C|nr:hypothetical protein [Occultella aeris]
MLVTTNSNLRSRTAAPTPGRGLQGIAERVEVLGGRLLHYGVDDGGATFRVTVTLPWR